MLQIRSFLFFNLILFFSPIVFSMGQQPKPIPVDAQNFAKICAKAAQNKFKEMHPKDKITSVRYSIDQKNPAITYVTISANDGNGCSHSSPAVVACFDFGSSASAKCLSGKLIEFF